MLQSRKVFLGLPLRAWTHSLPSGKFPFLYLVVFSFCVSPISPSLGNHDSGSFRVSDLLPRGTKSRSLDFPTFYHTSAVPVLIPLTPPLNLTLNPLGSSKSWPPSRPVLPRVPPPIELDTAISRFFGNQ